MVVYYITIKYYITYHPPAPPLSQHDQSKAACPHCCLGHEHPKTWEPGLSMRKSSINSDEPTLLNAKKKWPYSEIHIIFGTPYFPSSILYRVVQRKEIR